MARYPSEPIDGHVFMDECLGLVAFEFPRIIWIPLEVAALKNFPVYCLQFFKVGKVLRRLQVCVPVGEDERLALGLEVSQRRDENYDLVV